MKEILFKLAQKLETIDLNSSQIIYKLAGRYDKVPIPNPPELQPAFKYIMYLKLMKGLDDTSFHHMKRKYLNTSPDIQEECTQELNKLINQDALKFQISSAEIRKDFEARLKNHQIDLDL